MGLFNFLFGYNIDDKYNKLINLGKKYLSNKQFAKANYYFDEAIQVKFNDSRGHSLRGICNFKLNNLDKAIIDFTYAINYNDTCSFYYYFRGLTYFKVGNLINAFKDFDDAILLGFDYNRIKTVLLTNGYFKKNIKEFDKLLSQKNIKLLYHFTDKENLNSIIENKGLYSWSFCSKNRIIPIQGSNYLSRELDIKKKIQDYVHLSFNKNHPMLYIAKKEGRIRNPIFLEISTETILFKDTLFSNENATSNSAHIGNSIEDLKRINFDFALSGNWKNESEKKHVQAEVLVKEFIPIMYIKNLRKNG